MLRGFKEFILRGNVVELAVAVVIGSAFNAVVTSVVDNLIKPLIQLVPSVGPQGGLVLRHNPGGADVVLGYGNVINALITFVLIAAVVYFAFVLPMNKLAEMRAKGREPEPEKVSEEVALLREIRDSLARRQD
ncbi:large conductance mechanosensitive channel protein MscL [Fodinicola acaciae]|uniref:large conductance mechanosensitive channel protein MscL n=1 Tax=Fodinicola acaciae TaxID=2681555 RepID=UPI0013D41449|nr:large conductance mechanosensitive channel protein MscL [Fodinicola acaciae]